MSSDPVAPLRIQKSTPGSSPTKMPIATNRPLSELSPSGIRRNSPSFPQGDKGTISKGDSSPFDSSPFSNITTSPRLFWRGREFTTSPGRLSAENRLFFERENTPPVCAKQSSIENLKKASRVKNSTMFEREHKNEYDPSRVTYLDRPLASGRPLSMQFQGNAYGARGLDGSRKAQTDEASPPQNSDTTNFNPSSSTGSDTIAPLSPSRNQSSPMKSSLSKRTGMMARHMGFDPENGIWSEDQEEKELPEGPYRHRHAKSVTFDQAPPQINEYEMTTPDPSSIASGSREGSYDSNEDFDDDMDYERGSSIDHEDSFDASLEDTDKTPVVLPEDWRFMSPDRANDELIKNEEDPFDGEYGSPEPTAQPGMKIDNRPHQTSVASVDSNGQARPLPPLPGFSPPKDTSLEASNRLSGTVERVSSAQRSLPSPPLPAPFTKSDLRGMGRDSMNLEDRLRLMMSQDHSDEKTEAEKQRERRMRRANSKERSPAPEADNKGLGVDLGPQDRSQSEEFDDGLAAPPPRISRESILAKIRGDAEFDYDDDNSDNASVPPSSSPERALPDPDVAIPSLENEAQAEWPDRAIVKEEAEETDIYSIPDLYSRAGQDDEANDMDDDASLYSQPSYINEPMFSNGFAHRDNDDGQDTPRANSPERADGALPVANVNDMDLPAFANLNLGTDFGLGLRSYMTPSPPPQSSDQAKKAPSPPQLQREAPDRPSTPELQVHSASEEDEPRTPDSVIHHSLADADSDDSALIEEPEATVKAPGSHLKTRPSISPADSESMAATRRRVSGQSEILDDHMENGNSRDTLGEIDNLPSHRGSPADAENNASPGKRVSSLVQLEIPKHDDDLDLSLGLDKEFDRVIEAQKVEFELSLSQIYTPSHGQIPSSTYPKKVGDGARPSRAHALPGAEYIAGQNFVPHTNRVANKSALRQRGYLMRQNTKIVVASNRPEEFPETQPVQNDENVPPASTSPRKPSQQTWTTEPWNSKSRRRSIKMAGGSPRKRPADGPVPPLPGQASANEALDSVDELQAVQEDDESGDAERGRLFVKVVGVKDLDLALPRGERSYFALTLDNGLHCVTTTWLELGRTAPIGQEFELVVLTELEFQLTLQVKLEEPRRETLSSPVKAPSSPKKPSTFSRVFGSPKKRKELEQKQMESQRSKSPVRPQQPTLYDMVDGIAARDGSFARAYVSLSEHEKRCFGRPYTVDITCFNEWAMEEATNGSNRSKKGLGMQRRPPYKIGKLELQMLYVPKPKGARDEDMPKSMNACIREMREAETSATTQWEGFLSQQGGDCPYWRRRFFKLNGTKLTAFHESTLQPRANINLSKAVKVIDDKSSLTKKETSTRGGGRRKSGFAEEEEGYMFVEEGFRIRFANGEVIDFYADSQADKDGWMKALSESVGRNGASGHVKAWTELVLKQEQAHSTKKGMAKSAHPEVSPRKSSKSGPQEQAYAQSAKNPFAAQPQVPYLQQPRHHQAQRPGHARTESHQGIPTGSPVKDMRPRHQKARSMADMNDLRFA